MLKQRLITVAVLGPLVIWGIVALPLRHIAMFFALVVALGAWEWAALMGLASYRARLAYTGVVMLLVIAGASLSGSAQLVHLVLALAAGWWLAALLWVRRFTLARSGAARARSDTPFSSTLRTRWFLGAIGIVVLFPAWLSLVTILNHGLPGRFLVVFLLLLVWGADTGAYLAGSRWGVTKLAPQVSPGKTWEGVYGGVAVALVWAIVGGLLLGYGWRTQVTLVLLSLVAVLFSIVGDLFESMLKRRVGIKDSGSLLPGHGGVLDRIDSLTAAAPIFGLGLLLEGVIA